MNSKQWRVACQTMAINVVTSVKPEVLKGVVTTSARTSAAPDHYVRYRLVVSMFAEWEGGRWT